MMGEFDFGMVVKLRSYIACGGNAMFCFLNVCFILLVTRLNHGPMSKVLL
jgi:hypothetical protein